MTIQYTFSTYSEPLHKDWKDVDGVGIDAPAYLLTGVLSGGDYQRDKQIVYMTAHFAKTETQIPALTITGSDYINGTANLPYEEEPWFAINGIPPYSWVITGNIPAGLEQEDSTSSTLTGVPLASGLYTGITVQVTDANDYTVSVPTQIFISPGAPSFLYTSVLTPGSPNTIWQVSLYSDVSGSLTGNRTTAFFQDLVTFSIPSNMQINGQDIQHSSTRDRSLMTLSVPTAGTNRISYLFEKDHDDNYSQIESPIDLTPTSGFGVRKFSVSGDGLYFLKLEKSLSDATQKISYAQKQPDDSFVLVDIPDGLLINDRTSAFPSYFASTLEGDMVILGILGPALGAGTETVYIFNGYAAAKTITPQKYNPDVIDSSLISFQINQAFWSSGENHWLYVLSQHTLPSGHPTPAGTYAIVDWYDLDNLLDLGEPNQRLVLGTIGGLVKPLSQGTMYPSGTAFGLGTFGTLGSYATHPVSIAPDGTMTVNTLVNLPEMGPFEEQIGDPIYNSSTGLGTNFITAQGSIFEAIGDSLFERTISPDATIISYIKDM